MWVGMLFFASYLSVQLFSVSLSLALALSRSLSLCTVLSVARYAADYKVIIVVITIFIIEINADKPISRVKSQSINWNF